MQRVALTLAPDHLGTLHVVVAKVGEVVHVSAQGHPDATHAAESARDELAQALAASGFSLGSFNTGHHTDQAGAATVTQRPVRQLAAPQAQPDPSPSAITPRAGETIL